MKSLAVQQVSYGQDNYSFVVVPVAEGQESSYTDQGHVLVTVEDDVASSFLEKQAAMIAFQDELSGLFNKGNNA